MLKHPVRSLLILWVAWAVLLLGYQSVVPARFSIRKPDSALFWTANETNAHSQDNKPYLMDGLMNRQVSWDSEYYLSIANGGYNDPIMRRIPTRVGPVSQNYAFFPLYPFLIRAAAFPLQGLPLTPIGRLSLAGVVVSLLGTLAGILALYDLVREELEESGGLRAAFYLLIFPSGFFLAQVYTEGLFVGLSFGALALLRRKQWLWAAVLAGLATWTRAVGVALAVPLGIAWLQSIDWRSPLRPQLNWRLGLRFLAVLLPVAAFLGWRSSNLGTLFMAVEDSFFRRGLFAFQQSRQAWIDAWRAMTSSNLQARIYFAIEFLTVGLAVLACLLTLRRYPGLALYGLLVIAVSALSGVAQSQGRYALVVPSIYIVLSRWGRRPVFDRAWSLASILLMGLMGAMFTFDMWAG